MAICEDLTGADLCLADAIQRRIAVICNLEENRVQPDWNSSESSPRAAVRDQGESSQSESTDSRHSVRTFRIRYYAASKADCYERRLQLRAMDRDPTYVTREGYAKPYRMVMGDVIKTMGEWRVELALLLCQNSCIDG